ncbi:hypothetical protein HNR00_001375 [Methylorubrum rhodinum]|uniref:Uncharacterized protein n=1 Tax=Methylorubrum rhodinum TaxID=29428 RepID=A0A840ZHS2_9HYPH|nr:hypothetical protein [Methylorubrum rhodinum]MBB5756675.1 hypothetical protein [Methylorubrum rhodinum]
MKRNFHATGAETAKAAEIAAGLYFHNLRGTSVTMLAEAGLPGAGDRDDHRRA